MALQEIEYTKKMNIHGRIKKMLLDLIKQKQELTAQLKEIDAEIDTLISADVNRLKVDDELESFKVNDGLTLTKVFRKPTIKINDVEDLDIKEVNKVLGFELLRETEGSTYIRKNFTK